MSNNSAQDQKNVMIYSLILNDILRMVLKEVAPVVQSTFCFFKLFSLQFKSNKTQRVMTAMTAMTVTTNREIKASMSKTLSRPSMKSPRREL